MYPPSYQENPESGVCNSKACLFIIIGIVLMFILFIVGGPFTLMVTIPAMVLLILVCSYNT